MFPNYLQREAVKQIHVLWKHFLKVSINIRRSYFYKCNNNLTKEGYELPDIQFWAHMRSQISKPTHLRNWLFTNRDLLSTRSARGLQTFHSELSVVWAKRSFVANKIESKSYYSPLILHSVRVVQKICVWIHKNKRFVETVLLSTHETLHIKKYTLYLESNASYILFDICGCFDVPGFELSRFYSIAATSKSKNSVFASSANMSK